MSPGRGERPPRDETERLLRAEMAKALKAYLATHPDEGPISHLSAKIGVDRWTLGEIMRGTITASERATERLYELTQAQVFRNLRARNKKVGPTVSRQQRPSIDELLEEVDRLRASIERLRRSSATADASASETRASPEKATVRSRAQTVGRILGELDRELAFFKDETQTEARHVLRRVVDAKDVGYLIALLKAMYDDDAFENWIFGAQYGRGK